MGRISTMKLTRVVIDGECNFCRFSSNILVKIVNRPLNIQFQGSKEAKKWEEEFTHTNWKIDSIKVVIDKDLYIKSSAIAYLMQDAKWYFQPFRVIFFLPQTFLDLLYDFVARNRFLWGKTCKLNV